MKLLSLSFVFLVSFSAFAENIEAQGQLFHVNEEGVLDAHDAIISLPSQGKGDVYLKTEKGEMKAHRFFSYKSHGRTVFYVIFKGEGKMKILRGSYLRGTNLAKWYGDMYVKKTHHHSHRHFRDIHRNWRHHMRHAQYVGGFNFEKAIESGTREF